MLKVIAIGRLVRDPEVREIVKEKKKVKVCEFDVAANNRGEEHTNFFTVVTFGALAENVELYLFKGSRIGVSGNLKIESFERKDGSKGTSVKVYDAEIEFLSTKKEAGNAEV